MTDESKPKRTRKTAKQMESAKKNLVPLSSEEARKNGEKGGKRSVEVRRERKAWRINIQEALSLPTDEELESKPLSELKALSKKAIEEANLSQQEKITIAIIREALRGNVKAADWLAEMSGDKVDKLEITADVNIKDDPAVVAFRMNIKKHPEKVNGVREMFGDVDKD